MANKTVQRFGRTGGTVTFGAADVLGDSFPYNGTKQKLHFKNGGGATRTITLHGQQPCNLGSTHDNVMTVAAGLEGVFDNFGPEFADANGKLQVTYDAVTSLTVASYI